MAYINSHRSAALKSELDLFAVPPTQNSVEDGSMHCYRPMAALADSSPIEFIVSGHGDEYIDLAHTALHLLVKIVPEVPPPANVGAAVVVPVTGPINNWMHSIFSQVDVYLNQKCVTPPSNHYNYRAYIENLLNYGSDAKNSHLRSVLWEKDVTNFDSIAVAENTGFGKRYERTKDTKTIELYGNLHCDLFNQDKFLLNGVEINVRLIKANAAFHLMSAGSGNIEIVDANLFVRKVKINPSILVAHARALSIAPAKYPITRVDIKSITIPTGVQSKSIDNLYLGQLPKRCIVGFVRNEAYNGDFKRNPFKFEHFNYNFLALYIDSVQIPSKPLTPSFANSIYTRSYHTLFSGSGIHFGDTGNEITLDEYPNGFCLAAFDLTADLSSHESHWNIIRSGSLRLEVRFENPLPDTITALIYSEFDNLIEIDSNRNIIIDYSS